jgi:hypothetical protein
VIQDFDGPEPAPSRRGHTLVISFLLLLGVVAGYAAVSSPELRGPYATPRPLPSVVSAPRFTPAPAGSVEPASLTTLGFSFVCVVPGSAQLTWIFVNGQNVTVTSPTGQNMTVSLPTSVSTTCPVFWGQPPSPIEDRIAR